MRKNERKALQEFMNKIHDIDDERDYAFHRLQEMSRENGMPVYCDAKTNWKQLIEADVPMANYYYKHYLQASAKYDLIEEYGSMLANIDFWKGQYEI